MPYRTPDTIGKLRKIRSLSLLREVINAATAYFDAQHRKSGAFLLREVINAATAYFDAQHRKSGAFLLRKVSPAAGG